MRDGEDTDKVLVVSSDSDEDEDNVWKRKSKDRQFQMLWEKVQPILFHHVLPEYKSKYFPYAKFQELAQDLRKCLICVHVQSTEAFIWKNIIRWLISMKLCYEGISDLKYDEKYNLILTDFMAQYMNYNCNLYSTITDETEVNRKVDEILMTLGLVFSGNSLSILMTLLKMQVKESYRAILYPIFRKYLSNKNLHQPDDLISYLGLIFCYRRWKQLARLKEDKELINVIAVGKSEKALKSEIEPNVDLTIKEPVLPKAVPPVNETNKGFAVISGIMGFAIRNKNYGTRILLINKTLDLEDMVPKYFQQYEKYISRTDTILSQSTNALKVFDNAWNRCSRSRPVPIGNLNRCPSSNPRLPEKTAPRPVPQNQRETEQQDLQSDNNIDRRGNVGQHLSNNCDISRISNLSSNNQHLSPSFKHPTQIRNSYVPLSVLPKRKGFIIELDTTDDENDIDDVDDIDADNEDDDDEDDDDDDDDDDYNDRDKAVGNEGHNSDEKDKTNAASCEKQTLKTNDVTKSRESYLEKLQQRAEAEFNHSIIRRPNSPIILTSSSDEEEIVALNVSPRHAAGSSNPTAQRSSHRRKEKPRCTPGEVSSTTSVDCSSTPDAETAAVNNVATLENAREVGVLSVVSTSPRRRSTLENTDSDISDDDVGPSTSGRRLSDCNRSCFSKVVEEATSSTSEIPLRCGSEGPSENVIFSVQARRPRRSTSSSPCPTRTNSPIDSYRKDSPSSTIRTGGASCREYEIPLITPAGRISVRRLNSLYGTPDDDERPTCSRYVRRLSDSSRERRVETPNLPVDSVLDHTKKTRDVATSSRCVESAAPIKSSQDDVPGIIKDDNGPSSNDRVDSEVATCSKYVKNVAPLSSIQSDTMCGLQLGIESAAPIKSSQDEVPGIIKDDNGPSSNDRVDSEVATCSKYVKNVAPPTSIQSDTMCGLQLGTEELETNRSTQNIVDVDVVESISIPAKTSEMSSKSEENVKEITTPALITMSVDGNSDSQKETNEKFEERTCKPNIENVEECLISKPQNDSNLETTLSNEAFKPIKSVQVQNLTSKTDDKTILPQNLQHNQTENVETLMSLKFKEIKPTHKLELAEQPNLQAIPSKHDATQRKELSKSVEICQKMTSNVSSADPSNPSISNEPIETLKNNENNDGTADPFETENLLETSLEEELSNDEEIESPAFELIGPKTPEENSDLDENVSNNIKSKVCQENKEATVEPKTLEFRATQEVIAEASVIANLEVHSDNESIVADPLFAFAIESNSIPEDKMLSHQELTEERSTYQSSSVRISSIDERAIPAFTDTSKVQIIEKETKNKKDQNKAPVVESNISKDKTSDDLMNVQKICVIDERSTPALTETSKVHTIEKETKNKKEMNKGHVVETNLYKDKASEDPMNAQNDHVDISSEGQSLVDKQSFTDGKSIDQSGEKQCAFEDNISVANQFPAVNKIHSAQQPPSEDKCLVAGQSSENMIQDEICEKKATTITTIEDNVGVEQHDHSQSLKEMTNDQKDCKDETHLNEATPITTNEVSVGVEQHDQSIKEMANDQKNSKDESYGNDASNITSRENNVGLGTNVIEQRPSSLGTQEIPNEKEANEDQAYKEVIISSRQILSSVDENATPIKDSERSVSESNQKIDIPKEISTVKEEQLPFDKAQKGDLLLHTNRKLKIRIAAASSQKIAKVMTNPKIESDIDSITMEIDSQIQQIKSITKAKPKSSIGKGASSEISTATSRIAQKPIELQSDDNETPSKLAKSGETTPKIATDDEGREQIFIQLVANEMKTEEKVSKTVTSEESGSQIAAETEEKSLSDNITLLGAKRTLKVRITALSQMLFKKRSRSKIEGHSTIEQEPIEIQSPGEELETEETVLKQATSVPLIAVEEEEDKSFIQSSANEVETEEKVSVTEIAIEKPIKPAKKGDQTSIQSTGNEMQTEENVSYQVKSAGKTEAEEIAKKVTSVSKKVTAQKEETSFSSQSSGNEMQNEGKVSKQAINDESATEEEGTSSTDKERAHKISIAASSEMHAKVKSDSKTKGNTEGTAMELNLHKQQIKSVSAEKPKSLIEKEDSFKNSNVRVVEEKSSENDTSIANNRTLQEACKMKTDMEPEEEVSKQLPSGENKEEVRPAKDKCTRKVIIAQKDNAKSRIGEESVAVQNDDKIEGVTKSNNIKQGKEEGAVQTCRSEIELPAKENKSVEEVLAIQEIDKKMDTIEEAYKESTDEAPQELTKEQEEYMHIVVVKDIAAVKSRTQKNAIQMPSNGNAVELGAETGAEEAGMPQNSPKEQTSTEECMNIVEEKYITTVKSKTQENLIKIPNDGSEVGAETVAKEPTPQESCYETELFVANSTNKLDPAKGCTNTEDNRSAFDSKKQTTNRNVTDIAAELEDKCVVSKEVSFPLGNNTPDKFGSHVAIQTLEISNEKSSNLFREVTADKINKKTDTSMESNRATKMHLMNKENSESTIATKNKSIATDPIEGILPRQSVMSDCLQDATKKKADIEFPRQTALYSDSKYRNSDDNKLVGLASIQIKLHLRRTEYLLTEDDSNLSTQVQVSSDDLGSSSCFGSEIGDNSPAYTDNGYDTPRQDSPNTSIRVEITSDDLASSIGSETMENCSAYQDDVYDTPRHEISTNSDPNKKTNFETATYPTEDQEVSLINTQVGENLPDNTYDNDRGTPVLDERNIEEAESPSNKIVTLSVLKTIPTTFSNRYVSKSLPKSAGALVVENSNHFSNLLSSPPCPGNQDTQSASRVFSSVERDDFPTATATDESRFIEPAPKPKPQNDSDYQKTPIKVRIKRRISECADINEEFNLGPSKPLKPMDISKVQAIGKNDEPVVDSIESMQSLLTPKKATIRIAPERRQTICVSSNQLELPNYNVPLNLAMHSQVPSNVSEEDHNLRLRHQESWFKKLGKSKTSTKTLGKEPCSPSKKPSDKSKEAIRKETPPTKQKEIIISPQETPSVNTNTEGRRRKPRRVMKRTEPSKIMPIESCTEFNPVLPMVIQTAAAQTQSTTYNPEDIKAATILSDMLKKTNKFDEIPKRTPVQFTRLTRSTSQLMDKLPYSDTTTTPTTTSITKKKTKETRCVGKKNNTSSSSESIWQHEQTHAILRSFTASAENLHATSQSSAGNKSTTELNNAIKFPTHSNCSSDSDDTGKLVIDLSDMNNSDSQQRSKAKTVRNCKRKCTSTSGKIASSRSIPKTDVNAKMSPPVVKYDERMLLSPNSVFKLTPEVDVYFSGPREQDSFSKSNDSCVDITISPVKRMRERTTTEDDVSQFYPLIQLTEDVPVTPKTRAKRDSKQTKIQGIRKRIMNQEEPHNECPLKTKSNTKSKEATAKPKSQFDTEFSQSVTQTKPTVEAKSVLPHKVDLIAKCIPAENAQAKTDNKLVPDTKELKPKKKPKQRLSFGIDAILGNRVDSPTSDRTEKEMLEKSTPQSAQAMSKEKWLTTFSLRKTTKVNKSLNEVVKELSEAKPLKAATVPLNQSSTKPKISIEPTTTDVVPSKVKSRRKSMVTVRTKPTESSHVNHLHSEIDISKIKDELRQLKPIRNRRKSARSAVIIVNVDQSDNSEENEPIQTNRYTNPKENIQKYHEKSEATVRKVHSNVSESAGKSKSDSPKTPLNEEAGKSTPTVQADEPKRQIKETPESKMTIESPTKSKQGKVDSKCLGDTVKTTDETSQKTSESNTMTKKKCDVVISDETKRQIKETPESKTTIESPTQNKQGKVDLKRPGDTVKTSDETFPKTTDPKAATKKKSAVLKQNKPDETKRQIKETPESKTTIESHTKNKLGKLDSKGPDVTLTSETCKETSDSNGAMKKKCAMPKQTKLVEDALQTTVTSRIQETSKIPEEIEKKHRKTLELKTTAAEPDKETFKSRTEFPITKPKQNHVSKPTNDLATPKKSKIPKLKETSHIRDAVSSAKPSETRLEESAKQLPDEKQQLESDANSIQTNQIFPEQPSADIFKKPEKIQQTKIIEHAQQKINSTEEDNQNHSKTTLDATEKGTETKASKVRRSKSVDCRNNATAMEKHTTTEGHIKQAFKKTKLNMKIRRLTIDDTNVIMTFEPSFQLTEKSSKHSKKHNKKATKKAEKMLSEKSIEQSMEDAECQKETSKISDLKPVQSASTVPVEIEKLSKAEVNMDSVSTMKVKLNDKCTAIDSKHYDKKTVVEIAPTMDSSSQDLKQKSKIKTRRNSTYHPQKNTPKATDNQVSAIEDVTIPETVNKLLTSAAQNSKESKKQLETIDLKQKPKERTRRASTYQVPKKHPKDQMSAIEDLKNPEAVNKLLTSAAQNSNESNKQLETTDLKQKPKEKTRRASTYQVPKKQAKATDNSDQMFAIEDLKIPETVNKLLHSVTQNSNESNKQLETMDLNQKPKEKARRASMYQVPKKHPKDQMSAIEDLKIPETVNKLLTSAAQNSNESNKQLETMDLNQKSKEKKRRASTYQVQKKTPKATENLDQMSAIEDLKIPETVNKLLHSAAQNSNESNKQLETVDLKQKPKEKTRRASTYQVPKKHPKDQMSAIEDLKIPETVNKRLYSGAQNSNESNQQLETMDLNQKPKEKKRRASTYQVQKKTPKASENLDQMSAIEDLKIPETVNKLLHSAAQNSNESNKQLETIDLNQKPKEKKRRASTYQIQKKTPKATENSDQVSVIEDVKITESNKQLETTAERSCHVESENKSQEKLICKITWRSKEELQTVIPTIESVSGTKGKPIKYTPSYDLNALVNIECTNTASALQTFQKSERTKSDRKSASLVERPGPKSRKKTSPTPKRKSLVCLLKRIKCQSHSKDVQEERWTSWTKVQEISLTKSQRKRKRISLDCDRSLTNSPISLRTRSRSTEVNKAMETTFKKIKLSAQEDNISDDESPIARPDSVAIESNEMKSKDKVEEQLDMSIENIFGNQLSETDGNGSSSDSMPKILLTNRPQGFERVPDNIFNNGDTNETNIETEYYPRILKAEDLMLKSPQTENSHQTNEFEAEEDTTKLCTNVPKDEPGLLKTECENDVSDNADNEKGTAPSELELDPFAMTNILDMNSIGNSPVFEENSIMDVLGITDKIISELSPYQTSDCMLTGNYVHKFQGSPLLLLDPDIDMTPVCPFAVQRKSPKRNADSFNSTKSEVSTDVEIDFENELFYSDLVNIQSRKNHRMSTTSTPVNVAGQHFVGNFESKTDQSDDAIFKKPISVRNGVSTSTDQSTLNYCAPPVEVSTEIGFESYDELIADNNHYFPLSVMQKSRKRDNSSFKNETTLEKEASPPPIVATEPELVTVEENDKESSKSKPNETICVEQTPTTAAAVSATESNTPSDCEKTKKPGKSFLDRKTIEVKINLPATSSKLEKIKSPNKLKSHPIPFWKSNKPKSSVPGTTKVEPQVGKSNLDVKQNVKATETAKPLDDNTLPGGTLDFSSARDNTLQADVPKSSDITQEVLLTKLPELDDMMDTDHKLGSDLSLGEPANKKPRVDASIRLSTDDLFDRLKRESPVNPLMGKLKPPLQQASSFETDDTSSRDSALGLVTAAESAAVEVVTPSSAKTCDLSHNTLPLVQSVSISSTPSRLENSPKILDTITKISENINEPSDTTKDMIENAKTLLTLSTTLPAPINIDVDCKPSLKRSPPTSEAKFSVFGITPKLSPKSTNKLINAPSLDSNKPSASVPVKASPLHSSLIVESTIPPLVTNMPAEHPLIIKPSLSPPSLIPKNLESVQKPSTSASVSVTASPFHPTIPTTVVTNTPAVNPLIIKPLVSPASVVSIKLESIKKPSTLSSVPVTVSPFHPTTQPSVINSPLIVTPISSASRSCSNSPSQTPKRKCTLTPLSKVSPAQSQISKKSTRTPSSTDSPSRSQTPHKASSSRLDASSPASTPSKKPLKYALTSPAKLTQKNTPTTSSEPTALRSLSAGHSIMVASLTAEINELTNDLKKLPQVDAIYSQHRERNRLQGLRDQKRKQLDELDRKHNELLKSDCKLLSKSRSHSERQPGNNHPKDGPAVHSSQRESKDKERRRVYVNKFAGLKPDKVEQRAGTSGGSKTLASWDPNPASTEEIIAELNMKQSWGN